MVNSTRPLLNPQKMEATVNTMIAPPNTERCTKAVGYPSADWNEDRERQQIGSHADTQAHGRDAESGGHVGQGGRDHRRIQILHEISTGDDQRDDDWLAA